MSNMKTYTFDEVKDQLLGPIGSAARDDYESSVAQARYAFLMGAAVKNARQQQHLTQEELGNKIGVKRSQISKIEKGKNLTFATVSRVFRALNVPASLTLQGIGTVALW